ncbi:fructose-bisphosphatase class I, partial [Candidatus Falkowbacteria bacterium]|nr:fructose-bisphosphatase class I [Candidatus Falkowbacteria bacterium]
MSLDLQGLALPQPLGDAMTRLAQVGVTLARIIARNGIDTNLAEARGVNIGGDGQKALDVIADEAFMDALMG